jgi:hypothetical protein
MGFWAHGTNAARFVIQRGGNVGIGTTSPTQLLDVRGKIYSISSGTDGGEIRLANSGGGSTWYWAARTTGLNLGELGAADGRIFIANGGNVGIGTTSPSEKLHLNNASGTGTFIRFQDTSGGGVYIGGRDERMELYAGGSERMRITSGGNVGIGTTSPGDSKLAIRADWVSGNGTIKAYPVTSLASGGAAGYAVFDSNGTTRVALFAVNSTQVEVWGQQNTPMVFATNDSIKMTILANGNVGIGTTSPDAILAVHGQFRIRTTNGDGNENRLLFNPGGAGDPAQLYLYNEAQSNTIYVTANGASYFNAGSVGIGTTSPAYKLDVSGDYRLGPTNGVYFQSYTYGPEMNLSGLNSGGWARASRITTADTSNTVFFGVLGNNTSLTRAYWNVGNPSDETGYSYSTGISLLPGGNVGIGTTSPTYTLQVNGSGYFNTTLYVNGATTVDDNFYVTNGSVGIGTTSPSKPLDIVANSGANALQIRNRSNDDYGFIIFNNYAGTDTSIAQIGAYRTGTNTGELLIYTGTTEKIRIKNDGNVGIGTTSPSYKLHVYTSDNEGIYLQGTGGGIWMNVKSASGKMWSYGAQNDGCGIYNRTDGAYAFFIKDNGNTGIGTTSPSAKLHVNPSSTNEIAIAINGTQVYAGADNYQRISAGDQYSLSRAAIGFGYNASTEWDIKYSSYGNHSFWTGNDWGSSTEKMRIKSDGNVGIGTTSPTAKLHIYGDGSIRGLRINATATNQYSEIQLAADSREFRLGVPGSTASAANKFYIYDATAGDFRFILSTDGNIGIGTTTPSYKLDVAGTIRATGDVIAYSDARVKENVNTITDALTKVTSLRGVSYTRNDNEDKSEKVGVIAQEVLEVLPQVVQQDTNGNYSVAYGNMVGVLIEAIKEQQKQIDELKYLLQNK